MQTYEIRVVAGGNVESRVSCAPEDAAARWRLTVAAAFLGHRSDDQERLVQVRPLFCGKVLEDRLLQEAEVPGSLFEETGHAYSVCIGCGCTDINACMTDDGPCAWLRVGDGIGVCSACPDLVECWDRADNDASGKSGERSGIKHQN